MYFSANYMLNALCVCVKLPSNFALCAVLSPHAPMLSYITTILPTLT